VAAYFLCANRGKRSVAIDIASPEGIQQVRELAREADVLIENYKVGQLTKYGLDARCLQAINPQTDLLLHHRLRANRAAVAQGGLRLRHPGRGGVDEHHRQRR
jgi:hypothetical protein